MMNGTRPYKSAYEQDIGHDIGHDMSCPYITYIVWRSDHLDKLAACCTYAISVIWLCIRDGTLLMLLVSWVWEIMERG